MDNNTINVKSIKLIKNMGTQNCFEVDGLCLSTETKIVSIAVNIKAMSVYMKMEGGTFKGYCGVPFSYEF